MPVGDRSFLPGYYNRQKTNLIKAPQTRGAVSHYASLV